MSKKTSKPMLLALRDRSPSKNGGSNAESVPMGCRHHAPMIIHFTTYEYVHGSCSLASAVVTCKTIYPYLIRLFHWPNLTIVNTASDATLRDVGKCIG